jgi:acetyl esterase/lipase
MQFHSFELPRAGRVVHGDCRLPEESGTWPAVLFLSDILLSRRHGFYPFLTQGLALSRVVFAYDAGHSGYSGSGGIDREVASGYTLSSELADVLDIVAALRRGALPCAAAWDGRSLALVGHGKGAALALHVDRHLRQAGLPAPQALALLAPPSTLAREGGEGGVQVPVDPAPGGQSTHEVVLGADFLADTKALQNQATLRELMGTTPASVLLVAAEEDVVCPVQEAELLLQAGHSPKDRLVVVEKAGHNFAAGDPQEGPTPALVYVRDVVDRFLREVWA